MIAVEVKVVEVEVVMYYGNEVELVGIDAVG